jgi:pyrroline-5-carboxylate reductase
MSMLFIGGGNMASALIGGLIAQGAAASTIGVVEIDETARERLSRSFGVMACPDLAASTIAGAQTVLLAVKPQQMREVAKALQSSLGRQLVISIAAGIRLADLSRWLGGHRKLVRVMPNTPALIGAGISGLYALPEVSAAERRVAADLLAAVGETLWCENEAMLDAVTAVSASGPAYVFYFLEAMEAAARDLGFSAADARRLTYATFEGSVKLARQSTEEPATLRARVTSKGGTTERALSEMERAAVKADIIAAIRAAAERAKELGDEFGRD